MNRSGNKAWVVLAVLLLAGCGKDIGPVAQLSSPLTGAETVAQDASIRLDGAGDAELYPVLPEINLDALTYEEISGTLAPGSGGAMGQYLKTWDKYSWFALVVPPSSVDPQGDAIDFKMRIPTKACYLKHPEIMGKLIIRMEPDNTTFLGPITLVGTWMPWEGAPPDSVYFYSGGEWGVATVTQVTPAPGTTRYQVSFQVNHFSDWELGPEPRKR